MSIGLDWHAERVQKIMLDHGIKTREELAKRLHQTGISRTTIYRVFDESWAGEATARILATIAQMFHVPLGHLVHEPASRPERSS